MYQKRRAGSSAAYSICLSIAVIAGCIPAPLSNIHQPYMAMQILHLFWRSIPGLPCGLLPRVFLTARLTLAMPATLFLLVTTLFGAAFVNVAQNTIPNDDGPPSATEQCGARSKTLCYQPVIFRAPGRLPVRDLGTDALTKSGILYLAFVFIVLLACSLFSGWVLLPSVLTEYKSPEPAGASDPESTRLGQWLSRGYAEVLRIPEKLLYLGSILFW